MTTPDDGSATEEFEVTAQAIDDDANPDSAAGDPVDDDDLDDDDEDTDGQPNG